MISFIIVIIEHQMSNYVVPEDALGFDKDMIKKKSVFLWSLMPLTRPIDTLVITLKDPNSKVGQMLQQLANDYRDFVEWHIN